MPFKLILWPEMDLRTWHSEFSETVWEANKSPRFSVSSETLNNSGGMGAESSSESRGWFDSSEVVLNVYDLTPFNNYTYWFGFGIFHSGIEGFWNAFSFYHLLFLYRPVLLNFVVVVVLFGGRNSAMSSVYIFHGDFPVFGYENYICISKFGLLCFNLFGSFFLRGKW